MKSAKIITAGLAILLQIALLPSCTKKPQEKPLNSAKEIRISNVDNYFPIIVAAKKGFFDREFNPDVKVIHRTISSGASLMEAMTAGEVDIAACGDMPVIQSRNNGFDVKIISTFFRSVEGYKLIAAKDSGIHSIKDLRGKRVAVMAGSTTHKLLLKFLESEQMTTDDIELLFLKTNNQLAAFVANTIDAACSQVPQANQAIDKTGAYEVLNAKGYDNIMTVVSGRNKFLSENPEYAVKFFRALFLATEWIKDNLDEAIQIMIDETGGSYDNLKLYYNTRTYTYIADQEAKEAIADTIKYLHAQKTISREIPADEIFAPEYLEAYHQRYDR